MASLKRICTLSLACGTLLLCGRAMAQIAPSGAGNNGTAITSDQAERYDDKHMTVFSGSVEALQNGARLVSDKLTVFTYAPGEDPNAQPAGGGKSSVGGKAAAPAQDETSTGSIKQMIAEGHAFYVTQNETARSERMVYDAAPDTITLTGGVVVVQGKNVLRGDKMVIDRKTGHTTAVSDATGRSNPNRVRAVIYNDNQNGPGQGSQGQAPQGQNAAKARAAPAKKP